jgi:hypothetical protein
MLTASPATATVTVLPIVAKGEEALSEFESLPPLLAT